MPLAPLTPVGLRLHIDKPFLISSVMKPEAGTSEHEMYWIMEVFSWGTGGTVIVTGRHWHGGLDTWQ